MKFIVFVLISSFLTSLSFFHFNYLIFFSLIPFFYYLNKEISLKHAFLIGFFWGSVFFSFISGWIRHVSYVACIFLILYLSIYSALFSLIFRYINIKYKNKAILIYAPIFIWISLDLIRAKFLSGFPWGFLSYSLAGKLNLIQIASIGGSYLVSSLIIFSNSLLSFSIINKKKYKIIFSNIIFLFSFFLISSLYGKSQIKNLKPNKFLLNIACIQPNIQPEIKWDYSYIDSSWEKYKLLSLISKSKGARFIIYPETILPVAWNQDKKFKKKLINLFREINLPVLVGIPYFKDGKYYNASLLFDKSANLKDKYFKTHLVPFGEYLPLRKFLFFLEKIYPEIGYYKKGRKLKVFKINLENINYKFSPIICYEDIFPNIIRKLTLLGADFLVNQSDESWFKKSNEVYLHNKIAVFRAIENRRSIIRATNTGITCVIDYLGKVRKKLPPFKADVLISDLSIYNKISFYTKYGWLFPYFCLIFTFVILYKARKR